MTRTLISLLVSIALAQSLCAATAADLVGVWVVDTDATWVKLQTLPQLSGLSAEQKVTAKDMLVTQLASVQFTFTVDKLISNMGGQNKTETYKVAASTDAGITCEGTDELGVITRSLVKVSGNTMNITNAAEPTQEIVLKRK